MTLTTEQRDTLTDKLAWTMTESMSNDDLVDFYLEKTYEWLSQQGDEDLLVLATELDMEV